MVIILKTLIKIIPRFVLIMLLILGGRNIEASSLNTSNLHISEKQNPTFKTGDIIKFNGEYNLSNTILINESNITIDGLKTDGTLSKLKISKQLPIIKLGQHVSSITIKNIILEGTLDTNNPQINFNESGIMIDTKASDIKINNVQINNSSGYGIFADLANNIHIDKTNIKNFGYAGFMGFSVKNVEISDSIIDGALSFNKSSIGNSTLAYNIAFTRKSDNNLNNYPRSENCIVRDSLIMNNKFWEGLDTHGGKNITFKNNNIKNVTKPIAAVPSEVAGEDKFAPQKVEIINNTIEYDSVDFRDIVQNGIVVSGTIKPKSTTKEYATGIIKDNTLSGYGNRFAFNGTNLLQTGSILIQATEEMQILDNTIFKSNYHAITLFYDNQKFLLENNTIDGLYVEKERVPKGKFYPTPSGISIRSFYNYGHINHNKISGNNNDPDLKIRGISLSTTENVHVTAKNNYFDQYILLPYYKMRFDTKNSQYVSI